MYNVIPWESDQIVAKQFLNILIINRYVMATFERLSAALLLSRTLVEHGAQRIR